MIILSNHDKILLEILNDDIMWLRSHIKCHSMYFCQTAVNFCNVEAWHIYYLLTCLNLFKYAANVKPFLIRRQVNAKEKLWDGPSIPDEDFAALSGITNIQSYDPHNGSLLSAFKSATGDYFKGSHCFADEESCKLLGSKLQDIKLQSAERAISSASLKKTDMDIEDFKSSVGVAVAALKDIMQNCRKFVMHLLAIIHGISYS